MNRIHVNSQVFLIAKEVPWDIKKICTCFTITSIADFALAILYSQKYFLLSDDALTCTCICLAWQQSGVASDRSHSSFCHSQGCGQHRGRSSSPSPSPSWPPESPR